MAAREKKSPLINLLPQEEFASSTLGRILAWVLSTFRIIVIVTEMVVMVAFLSRFWLDARNTDLSEEIEQKTAIIQSYSNFEKEFRDTQERLEILAALISKPSKSVETIRSVVGFLPPDIQLNSISLTQNSIQIKGTAAGERSIANFMANLTASNIYKDVSLTQVSSNSGNQYLTFVLKIEMKGEGSGT